MSRMVYGLWLINLTWPWNGLVWDGWLSKWLGFGMINDYILIVGSMMIGLVRT